ncbi:MAG: TraM recognition domain-containing protein [Actinomycetota bacterium]|nr:TraM recognition domain-containing protein [Actinomycetota bacterium]
MEGMWLLQLIRRLARERRGFHRQLGEVLPSGYTRYRRHWRRGVAVVLALLVLGSIHNPVAGVLFWLLLLALAGYASYRIKRFLEAPHGKETKAAKLAASAPPEANSHDLARVYHPAQPALPQRGWQVGIPIAVGHDLGMSQGRAWFPHGLLLGATGSGKTTLLRRFLARWLSTGPAVVMSTKGDIIPLPAQGTPGRVHLVTPQGRQYLDPDGHERLAALETAGWTVLDARWDPVCWLAASSDEAQIRFRAETLARCLAGVVADQQSGRFWSEAASGLITAGMLIEAATIQAQAGSWAELLDPQPLDSRAGSDRLLASATTTAKPGIERLVAELQLGRLTDLAEHCSEVPLTLSPIQRAAAGEVLETAKLLRANNVTALSRYQTMATALSAYKYPSTERPPVDIASWAASDHDLLVVAVPSAESEAWAAPMAALAVALWTEASQTAGDHLIILDEMASLAPVPGIHEWTAQGRSLGVHVVAVLQHEGQARTWSQDTAGWILNTWPLVLVAAGTPAVGLAKQLADGEGQHEVTKQSTTQRRDSSTWFGGMQDDGTTTSYEMRDRIEPNHVFDEAAAGAWRVIDRRVGPWAEAI